MARFKTVRRGEIYMANMEGLVCMGSEQAGTRPVLIIQNDVGNKHSPTTIVARITSANKTGLPTHMEIDLYRPSTILCEQISTISKDRLERKIGELPPEFVDELNEKLAISLGIAEGWH